jgi:GNAT superfamily N-acetyltransferase
MIEDMTHSPPQPPAGAPFVPASVTDLQLRPFEPGDADAFRDLNEAWIRKYFGLEEPDYLTLRDPIRNILQPGGHIFMAIVDGRAIGCCALIAEEPGVFELAKMAVAEEYRGRGVGRQILVYTIEQARALGATLLHLGSNRKLANAVHLYEALGFRHLPPERVKPSPYARADVFMELHL